MGENVLRRESEGSACCSELLRVCPAGCDTCAINCSCCGWLLSRMSSGSEGTACSKSAAIIAAGRVRSTAEVLAVAAASCIMADGCAESSTASVGKACLGKPAASQHSAIAVVIVAAAHAVQEIRLRATVCAHLLWRRCERVCVCVAGQGTLMCCSNKLLLQESRRGSVLTESAVTTACASSESRGRGTQERSLLSAVWCTGCCRVLLTACRAACATLHLAECACR